MKTKWFTGIKKVMAGLLAIQMIAIYLTPLSVGAMPSLDPQPITPGSGEVFTTDPADVTFSWSDTGATKYRLQKCNVEPVNNSDTGCTSGKSTIADNIVSTSFLKTYTSDQNFWWRVAAYNGTSWSTSLYGPARKLVVDTTQPSVSIVSPASSSWLKEDILVDVDANDTGSGIEKVDLYVNNILYGTTSTLNMAGNYEFTINSLLAPDGTYKIKATAFDKTGLNRTTSERTVYIDNTLPVVDIAPVGYASPLGDIYGGEVKIYYSDTNLVSATIDGSPAGVSPITVSLEGSHIFVATDKSNNIVTKNFTIDTTAPFAPSVTSTPVSGYRKTGGSATIHVGFDSKVFLTLVGLPTLTLNSGGVAILDPQNSGSGTNTLNFIYKVKAGEGTLDLDYSDANALNLNGSLLLDEAFNPADILLPYNSGGLLAQNSGLVIDTAKPVVANINTPLEGSFVSGLQPIRVSSSDNFGGSGIKNVAFYVDGVKVTTQSLPSTIFGEYEYMWDTSTYLDGSHTLFVKSTDYAGNVYTSVVTNITVDNTKPALTKFAVSSIKLGVDGVQYVNGSAGLTISANIADALSGFDSSSCYFTLDGGTSWNPANFETTRCRATGVRLKDYGFVDGDNSVAIGIKLVDLAGNETSTLPVEMIKPVVDFANPIVFDPIEIVYTYNGYTSSMPLLKVKAADSTSPITGCDYRVKYLGAWSAWTAASWVGDLDPHSGECSAVLSGLIDGGTYNFQVRAKDTVGRTDSSISTLTRIIDGIVDSVDAGEDIVANEVFTRVAAANDSSTGISATNWSYTNLDSGTGSVAFGNPTDLETTISADMDGRYEIFFTVNDNVGNIFSDSFILTWDLTGPEALYVEPTPDDGILSNSRDHMVAIQADRDTAYCQLGNMVSSSVGWLTVWGHSYPEDTNNSWSLTSPNGTVVSLPVRYANAGDGWNSWIEPYVYELNGFSGENPSGQWTLTMSDNVGRDSGGISQVNLYINGQTYTWSGYAGVWDYHTTTVGINVNSGLSGILEFNEEAGAWEYQINGLADGVYSYTATCGDALGNETSLGSRSISIDATAPEATFTYNPVGPTNSSVVATLNPSEDVSITNNDRLNTYTFTENGSFTFEFEDAAGNTGTATATVENIDNEAPTATVGYDIVVPTNTDVIATLSPSEDVSITNNDRLNTYTFTENGSFTFEFEDAAGNTGTATATVENIDKEAPVIALNGAELVIVEKGLLYTELATLTDNMDTSPVLTVLSLPVDTSSVGDTILGYTATDNAGNESVATRTVRVVDTTAPAIVTGLTATPGNATVVLNWTNPLDSDFAGVNIYRSTVAGVFGTTPINIALVTGGNYTDSGLVNGTTYYYALESVDVLGNASSDNGVTATPVAPTVTPAAQQVTPPVVAPTQLEEEEEAVLGAQANQASESNDQDVKGSDDNSDNEQEPSFWSTKVMGVQYWLWLMILAALGLGSYYFFVLKRKR